MQAATRCSMVSGTRAGVGEAAWASGISPARPSAASSTLRQWARIFIMVRARLSPHAERIFVYVRRYGLAGVPSAEAGQAAPGQVQECRPAFGRHATAT